MRPPEIVSKNKDDNNRSKQPSKEQIRLDVKTLCQNLDLSQTTLRGILKLLEKKYGGIQFKKSLSKLVKQILIETVDTNNQPTTKQSNSNKKKKKKKKKEKKSVPVVVDAEWMQFYNEAKNFIRTNGHFKIPNDRKDLQKWMKLQKKLYIKFHKKTTGPVIGGGRRIIHPNNNNHNNNNEPKLTVIQIQLLDGLGISWNTSISVKSALTWIKKYEELEQYVAEHGTTDVIKNRLLSNWAKGQRKRYHEKSLTKHQIKMMNDLNFNWQYKESLLPGPEWVKMYQASIHKIQHS